MTYKEQWTFANDYQYTQARKALTEELEGAASLTRVQVGARGQVLGCLLVVDGLQGRACGVLCSYGTPRGTSHHPAKQLAIQLRDSLQGQQRADARKVVEYMEQLETKVRQAQQVLSDG